MIRTYYFHRNKRCTRQVWQKAGSINMYTIRLDHSTEPPTIPQDDVFRGWAAHELGFNYIIYRGVIYQWHPESQLYWCMTL